MGGFDYGDFMLSGMTPDQNTSFLQPFHVGYVLIPEFSMLALSSAIEPLRSANRLLGAKRYRWSIIGTEEGPISASNGLEIQSDFDLDNAPSCDLTIVVASLDLAKYDNKRLLRHIRKLRRQDKMIGAISNGALLLAAAGVLDNRRVTTHWERLESLADSFPNVIACTDLFCIDGKIFTAAGGASSMDMMLELIARREGPSVAKDVAEQFLHGELRPGHVSQRSDIGWRYGLHDKRLQRVIRVMDENLSSPVTVAHLAQLAGLSQRQLERKFLEVLNNTPSRFYLNLRLARARERLLATTESLETVAESTGFSSQAHFSRAFKSWSGVSPKAIRKGYDGHCVG